PKLTIENFSLSTVVDDNRNLAINAVGEIISSGKMPLYLANIDNGDYTFTQQSLGDFQGVKISILDKYTNTIHDLSNGAAYNFTFVDNSGSRTTDRFVLIFGDIVDEYNQLALYPNPVLKTLAVYINSDQTPLGEVIDIMGKPVGLVNWEKAPDGPSWKGTFDMQSQSAGVYFVKVNLKEGAQVKRFLKN
ncbi:MAG TPA: T9SS type A sorting domain-containing protein, partial [Cyclobacteriaceae bacterium]|nr:T9SS type A sorting domain-containing protein [Cyclobacteriaceae bacterium]